jgi:hypothetical protein
MAMQKSIDVSSHQNFSEYFFRAARAAPKD